MGLIENPKTYRGRDLETIFFRPIFSGENAEQLGIRVLYNMPVPTTIQMWSPQSDILQTYSSGWNGGNSAFRKQKSIDLRKVKAEVGFSASDYFNQVYELITGRADVNLDDLTGSELLARCICHEVDHLDGKLFIDEGIHLRPYTESEKKKRK
jgi:hypothetical protein